MARKSMKNRNWGIVLSYLNTGLNMLCGFFLSSFLVKMLGDTEYGLYQMVTSFAGYLVLLEFGTGTAMTRNLSKCRAQNEDRTEIQKNISTIWTISLLLALVIFIVSTVFYWNIGNIYKNLSSEQVVYAKSILIFEVVYLVVSFLSNTTNGIVLGFERYEIGPIVSVVRLISRTVLLTSLVLAFRYSIIIAIVDLVVSLAVALFMFRFCIVKLKVSFSPKWFDMGIFKDTLPLCMAMFIQTIVNQANSNVDQFIIGIKLSPEQVSYYSIGLFFYGTFSSLATVPISMYAPQIVKDVATKVDNDILMEHLIAPSRLITLIGSTVICGFFVAGRQFISIFYGEQYKVSWYVALIIMIPMMINMSNGVLINVLDALNKRMSRSYVLLFTTIGNIILTIFWIDKWGVIGACLATAVCTIVGQITLMNIYYSRVLNIRVFYLYYRTYKGIILPQIIASLIVFFVGVIIHNNVISFLASGCVYVISFAMLFYFWGAEPNEKEMIKTITYNLLNKLRRS